MDIGDTTKTSFLENPEIVSFMVDNPELLDCYRGLIHSHHDMPAFFSGTDTNTLLSEGLTMNHFVSLIVNNDGPYTAAITRKVTIDKTINRNVAYKSFDNLEYIESYSPISEKEEMLEYFKLQIVIEEILEDDIIGRLKNIENNAQKNTKYYKNYGQSPAFNSNNTYKYPMHGDDNPMDYTTYNSEFDTPIVGNKNVTIDNDLPQDNIIQGHFDHPKVKKLDQEEENIAWETIFKEDTATITCMLLDESVFSHTFSLDLIKALTHQLLIGSIFMKADTKVDIKKFICNMDKTYATRFENVGIQGFTEWIESFSDFICLYALTAEEEHTLNLAGDESIGVLCLLINDYILELTKDINQEIPILNQILSIIQNKATDILWNYN